MGNRNDEKIKKTLQITTDNYELSVRVFKKYKYSYEQLLSQNENTKADSVIWSETYLDFYPFQHILDYNRKTPTKSYGVKPNNSERLIESRLKISGNDCDVYYSYSVEHKDNEVVFCVKENGAKVFLKFGVCYGTNAVALHYIYIVFYHESTAIDKVLFYCSNEFEEVERFSMSQYLYNSEGRVNKIIRDGLAKQYSVDFTVVPTITFRFDYKDEKTLIYAKQLKLDGTDNEKIIFSK